ncbi:uncharacterized protein LOC120327514 [Styela clava]|uniref:uncharacterized protein LOC120327514 n=1 Tax=Styela clava TaxID=7725 RepID=UPI00193A9FFC|nr:uncharacterized protein LOC120327514 [Styela clava]
MIDFGYWKALASAQYHRMKDGYKEMFYFTLDDDQLKRDAKLPPRPRKCFECEAIACGFFYSVSVYLYYLARMGRINFPSGMVMVSIFAAGGTAVLIDPRPFVKKGPSLVESDSNEGGNTILNKED